MLDGGAYLEGNGWLKSYLTGEQENNVKKESWSGKKRAQPSSLVPFGAVTRLDVHGCR